MNHTKIPNVLFTLDGDERPNAKWEHIFDISAVNYVLDIVAVSPCLEDLSGPSPNT